MRCVSAQSNWEVAQNNYEGSQVSAQSSREVAQNSYDVCHVSAQSSWGVAQSSYDECHVSDSHTDIFFFVNFAQFLITTFL